MFADLHFLQPGWLLLIPPLLFVWFWKLARMLRWPPLLPPPRLRFPLLAGVDMPSAGPPIASRSRLSSLLFAAGLTVAVVALAQPVRYTTTAIDTAEAEPVDLILVVGTAVTMGLRDYMADGKRVSRMTMLKQLLSDFVKRYSGRRLALVVLGDPPALWLPLTRDKHTVLDAISRLRTALGGRLSDTGGALKMIADTLSGSSERVVVLITDAGLQLGNLSPVDGARLLRTKGMTLHTIAVGSADPGAAENNTTTLLYEPVNLQLMQQLAEIGGGQMFRALDTEHMRLALQKIESLHRRPAPPTTSHQLVHPLYPWAIGMAMLLFLASMALPGQTASRRRSAG